MRLDETNLHDRFADVVDGAGVDLHGLAAGAERDGRRLRRRQRMLSVAGTAAAATLVVGSASVLMGRTPVALPAPAPATSGGVVSEASAPTDEPTEDALRTADGPRVPVTGRATAAALLDLVGQLHDGRAIAFAGQQTTPDPGAEMATESYAALWWQAAGSDVSTPVRINVQPGFEDDGVSADPKGYACEEGESMEAGTCELIQPDQQPFFSCREGRLRCTVTREDQMTVVSYEERNGAALDRIVDVYHPATLLRVVVAATNAEEFETARKVVEEPPLTLDELRRIATLDVWDATMPAAYDEAGARLAPYQDYSENLR